MRREAIHPESSAMRDCLATFKGQRLAFSGVFDQTDRWTQRHPRLNRRGRIEAGIPGPRP